MIVLDENCTPLQRDQLRRWRIRTRQVGDDFGRKGLEDQEIVALLHRARRATFISLDRDYYQQNWCHPRYCLVFLDVPKGQEALYVRRFLRHPDFDTEVKRLGCVIRVSPSTLAFRRLHAEREAQAVWS
jgi:hypothetical protein